MIKISIIMPVYNTEKFLYKTLNSLIAQTYKNFEIICVDDGSIDNSLRILKQFALNDNRIVIITQENQKQGAARNRALEIANGDYITFVDSDDWIDENYLELMINTLEKYNADVAVSSIVRIKKNKTKYQLKFNEIKTYEKVQEIINTIKIPPYWYVCGKLFKKEIIQNIRFEEGVLYEDADFLIKVIANCKRIVTVPNTKYNYVTNNQSVMRTKSNIIKIQNQINAMLKVFKFSQKNNIKLNEFPIFKERHLLYSIKHYQNRKDYFLFGLKYFSKKIKFDDNKTFVLFNTAYLGDVLVSNSLCQNIKTCFPNAKIVFICNKSLKEAAEYQKDVDEVIVYDKKGKHKGIFGFFKFIQDFPYKNCFASIIIYKNERNYLVSKFVGAKNIIMERKRNTNFSMQELHTNLLKKLTYKKLTNYPIKYELNNKNINYRNDFKRPYITLCTLTKNLPKDMPLSTAEMLIKKINKNNKLDVVFVGVGKNAENYAEKLKQLDCKFIDLSSKTTIYELANVIKNSKCLISVDTGTMHLGCALGIPVIAVFYEHATIKYWAPNPNLYNSILIDKNQTSENIFKGLKNLNII